jgi:Lon-like ATP-dependent protease
MGNHHEGAHGMLHCPSASFIANVLDTIPAPLLDHMEVIEVSGYISEEKSMIAERYLSPQAKEASGLKDADVVLDPAMVDVLIKYYCHKSGVRNLKKHIDKIYQKVSLKIVEDLGEGALPEGEAQSTLASATDKSIPAQDPPVNEPTVPETATPHVSTEMSSTEKKVTMEKHKPYKVPNSIHLRITPDNLKDYIGPPVYHMDRMYMHLLPAGISTSLGYLRNGSGAVMPIEATVSGSSIPMGCPGHIYQNPKYDFWSKDFIRAVAEVALLLDSVSCPLVNTNP